MTSLAQPVQAVVTLFEGPLSGVRFGDIDAAGLGKLAAEVARVQAEVEAHEAKLGELRQTLARQQESLLTLAQQALAYARIYAEGDDELTAQLNDIALPRATKPRKSKAATTEADAAPAADVSSAQPPSSEPVAGQPAEEPGAEAEAEAEQEPIKPSYARPKLKRKLGRASARGTA